MTLRSVIRLLAVGLVVAGAGVLTTPADAQSGPPAGRLRCIVGQALGLIVTSKRPMECRYTPRRGPVQIYTGVVRNFGLDVGTIRSGRMSWRVYGPYARAPLGALSGSYLGATASASAGTAGATVGNALVGGRRKSVTLQPASLQGVRRGYNVAAGVTGLDLTLARRR